LLRKTAPSRFAKKGSPPNPLSKKTLSVAKMVKALNYYSEGWNIFNFIVTPDELREVLSDFHHVINNRRVLADYVESDPEDFFVCYQKLYDKLSAGCKIENRYDWMGILYVGVTDNLSKCAYGEPFCHDDVYYKTKNFSECCPSICPFPLFIDHKKHINTSYCYAQMPEYTVGLSLSYPKKTVFYSKDDNGEITVHDELEADRLASFKVYQEIVKRVKSISKGMKITLSGKEYRPNVKISKNAEPDFYNFYFYKNNNRLETPS